MTAANHAASSPDHTPARVRLRPTLLSDLPYVVSLEHDEANLPFITPWDRTRNRFGLRLARDLWSS